MTFRLYYAKIDTMVYRSHSGYGFSNTKRIIAFPDREWRDRYVTKRREYDYSCTAVYASDAKKHMETLPVLGHDDDKGFYYCNESNFVVFDGKDRIIWEENTDKGILELARIIKGNEA